MLLEDREEYKQKNQNEDEPRCRYVHKINVAERQKESRDVKIENPLVLKVFLLKQLPEHMKSSLIFLNLV